jgi:hypothetical protein
MLPFIIIHYFYSNVSGGVRNFRRSGSEFIILRIHLWQKMGHFCGQKVHPLVVGFYSSWKLFFSVGNQKKSFYNFNTATHGGLKNILLPPALNGSKKHHSLRSTFPRLHKLRLWRPTILFLKIRKLFIVAPANRISFGILSRRISTKERRDI